MEEISSLLSRAEKIINTNGDLNKAKKFVEKAKHLGGGERASELLEKINIEILTKAKKANDKVYTKEQLEAIIRVKNCKDLYERLEVTKNATDADLKKAYKRLALQFHPDKNRAPGAAEAFKAISQAYTILSNPQKRTIYETSGVDRNGNIPASTQYTTTNLFEDDISPEELFNMFFGSHGSIFETLQRGNIYVHRTRNNHPQFRQQNSFFLQLLPIIIFLSVTFILNFFQSTPQYQFQATSPYTIKKQTSKRNVVYFVTPDFSDELKKKNINEFEYEVEKEYTTHLANMCYREEQERFYLIDTGRIQGRKDLIDRAQKMVLKNCDELKQYTRRAVH